MKTPEFATDTKDGRKSPEVIKQNARTCISQPATESCYCCPLHGECHGLVEYVIKDLLDLVLMYESRLAQVERERDAMSYDMHQLQGALCAYCGNLCRPAGSKKVSCKVFGDGYGAEDGSPLICGRFKWRGVCEENTKRE